MRPAARAMLPAAETGDGLPRAGSFQIAAPTLASADTVCCSDRHSFERNSAGLVVWKCGETARLLLAIVIAVGRILSGGHPGAAARKIPTRGTRSEESHRRREEMLRVVRSCRARCLAFRATGFGQSCAALRRRCKVKTDPHSNATHVFCGRYVHRMGEQAAEIAKSSSSSIISRPSGFTYAAKSTRQISYARTHACERVELLVRFERTRQARFPALGGEKCSNAKATCGLRKPLLFWACRRTRCVRGRSRSGPGIPTSREPLPPLQAD